MEGGVGSDRKGDREERRKPEERPTEVTEPQRLLNRVCPAEEDRS